MTTPTQAQIEAAKALIYRFEHESMALHHIQRDWLVKEIAALAAAAEVDQKSDHHPSDRKVVENGGGNCPTPLDAATIERCAQVADKEMEISNRAETTEQFKDGAVMASIAIAAAIRALKDKA